MPSSRRSTDHCRSKYVDGMLMLRSQLLQQRRRRGVQHALFFSFFFPAPKASSSHLSPFDDDYRTAASALFGDDDERGKETERRGGRRRLVTASSVFVTLTLVCLCSPPRLSPVSHTLITRLYPVLSSSLVLPLPGKEEKKQSEQQEQ